MNGALSLALKAAVVVRLIMVGWVAGRQGLEPWKCGCKAAIAVADY
jgi:hypothetical protein